MKTAQQLWDAADKQQRKAWLATTGSWADDWDMSWKELMAQGGSQADVMKDLLTKIATGKRGPTPLSALCDRELVRVGLESDDMRGRWYVRGFNYWAIVRAGSKQEAEKKFTAKHGEKPREARPAKVEDYSIHGPGEEIMSALCDRELRRVGLAQHSSVVKAIDRANDLNEQALRAIQQAISNGADPEIANELIKAAQHIKSAGGLLEDALYIASNS